MKKHIAIATAVAFTVSIAYAVIWNNNAETQRQKVIKEYETYSEEAIKQLKDAEANVITIRNRLSFIEACIDVNSHTGTYVDCDVIDYTKYQIEYVTNKKDTVVPVAQAEESKPEIKKLLEPNELFWPTKVSDKCYVSQTEHDHVRPERWGMFATDIACNFGEGLWKRAEVYAPDLRNKSVMFQVEHVGYDALLGSFIQLRALREPGYPSDESFYLGHTETKMKVGDVVSTGQRIGQMKLDGATTGWNVHVEYRRLGVDGKTWKSERYFTGVREQALDNKRKGQLPSGWKWGDKFYFTHYDLGDPNQNDSAPCHWASGKNLCDMEKSGVRTIALTVDVRNALGIKFGDKVRLEWPCAWTYQVEDEMHSRFRYACVNRDGLCIKGDIPSCSGWAHSVHPL